MNKNLICCFRKGDNVGSLILSTIDAESKTEIREYCSKISSDNVLSYFKNLPDFITKFAKACIFIQLSDFKSPDFIDFSQFVRFVDPEIYWKHHIRTRYIDGMIFNLTKLLVAVKIVPKMDEKIVFIIVSTDTVFVEEITRVKEGYMRPLLKDVQVIDCSSGYNPSKIKAEILAEHQNPDKIYITTCFPFSQSIYNDMLKLFGEDKALVLDEENENDTIIEIVKYLMDEKFNQYYIIPEYEFVVGNFQDKYLHQLPCNLKDGLPFTATNFDRRRRGQYYESFYTHIERFYKQQKFPEIVEIYPLLEGRFHKVKLTFTVDEKMTPKLTQEPFIDPLIEKLPLKLTETMSSLKIPIIGFFDNSSIICLWNQKECCYKFCKKWNGLYGEDLFISFDEEKPKYRKQAMKTLHMKGGTVVYDLMNILPAKPDNIYVNPEWPFTITKDEENPILLEFDNFDETRKLATPEFLMALLLKDHLKVIKEETGTKPAEIGILFFDKIENTKFWDAALLEEKIKASCSLIKLGCKIINVDEL